nr:M15 family metallopeptidase [Candidatus Gracilibacteria bacterium]
MKNIFKKKLFKVNSKVRVYVYIFTIFFTIIFLCIIYLSHQNRILLNTIKYYYPVVNNSKIITELDFQNDDSITKFVNNKVSFNNLSYIPSDLESISSTYVFDSKGNSRLRSEANLALQNMAKDFYNYFGKKIVVVSAYRSYLYQVGIKAGGCSDIFCAKAGFSEHQTGLAVDLWEASSKEEFLSKQELVTYFNWLKNNAYKYGFNNSYQKGLEVDGYNIEPWHWRYLGLPLAKKLYDNNQTFAEYYHSNN